MSGNVQIMKKEDAIRVSKEKADLLPLIEIHMLHTVAHRRRRFTESRF